jgi:transcriptional regulator with XRE-family HTH domain
MTFDNEKLVDLRWSKRLKQNQLAKMLGIDPSMVCNWEKGFRFPTKENIDSLAAVLQVDRDYFFR